MKTRPWNRRLWGIAFYGGDKGDTPMLIGTAWDKIRERAYVGEPARALLFRTRRQAREWCRNQNQKWIHRQDILSKWRVRPVRVQETLTIREDVK